MKSLAISVIFLGRSDLGRLSMEPVRTNFLMILMNVEKLGERCSSIPYFFRKLLLALNLFLWRAIIRYVRHVGYCITVGLLIAGQLFIQNTPIFSRNTRYRWNQLAFL